MIQLTSENQNEGQVEIYLKDILSITVAFQACVWRCDVPETEEGGRGK